MKKGENKKRILVVCPHPTGVAPAQRLKYEQYFPNWEANGYCVTVKEFVSPDFHKIIFNKGHFFEKFFYTLIGYKNRVTLLFSLRKYDIVYIFLWVTPLGFPFFEWLYIKMSKAIVYDIDDLIFHKNNKSGVNKVVNFFKGRAKPILLMKHSGHIITTTPFLVDYCRQFNKQVTSIPPTLNTDIIQPKMDYSPNEKFVIGWSGSHSTVSSLCLLKEMLLELRKTIDFKLIVMGADFQEDNLEIENVQWTADIEMLTIKRFDIGLYPLPIDDEWVLGKFGGKTIQYMTMGIPTIATDIGYNNLVIENHKSGYLVKTKEEWINAIIYLYKNPDERKKMGEYARHKAEHLYSLNANAPTYLKILEDVSNFQQKVR